jgi:2-dehydropantoate 2-reductase
MSNGEQRSGEAQWGSVGVIGAGALGGIFGARLALAGVRVTMVDSAEPIVRAISEHGLRLTTEGNEKVALVDISNDINAVRQCDAVIVLVKSFHTAVVASQLASTIPATTVVMTLQNGWGHHETLSKALPDNPLVMGVTYNSAMVTAPGAVTHSGSGPTYVGSPTAFAHANSAAATLSAAGFDAVATEEVESEIWKKLVLNASSLPVGALTRLTAGELAACEESLAVVESAAREVAAVANASGRPIDVEERLQTIRTVLARGGAGKGSMQQDVEAGRRTEIEAITGSVIREADSHGIEVPSLRALHGLVRGVEVAAGSGLVR